MSLEAHQQDYKPNAWDDYSFQELGQWVHLLTKRSEHRDNLEKRNKDLYDAQNYLDMMQNKLSIMKNKCLTAIQQKLQDELDVQEAVALASDLNKPSSTAMNHVKASVAASLAKKSG